MEVGQREICRFNLKGICRFGHRCWNLHQIPSRPFERAGFSGAGSSNSPAKSNEQAPSTSTVSDVISAAAAIDEENEKTCGICFDTVLKKVNRSEQIFGLLPNCSHCFCYSCITRWRQSKEFDFEVSKSCPECRTASDFVYRSRVWMEQSAEKTSFIDSKKQQMKKMHCKYFKRGRGPCPFGNKCLYLHALMDGTVVDVGEPRRRRKRAELLGNYNWAIEYEENEVLYEEQEEEQSDEVEGDTDNEVEGESDYEEEDSDYEEEDSDYEEEVEETDYEEEEVETGYEEEEEQTDVEQEDTSIDSYEESEDSEYESDT